MESEFHKINDFYDPKVTAKEGFILSVNTSD